MNMKNHLILFLFFCFLCPVFSKVLQYKQSTYFGGNINTITFNIDGIYYKGTTQDYFWILGITTDQHLLDNYNPQNTHQGALDVYFIKQNISSGQIVEANYYGTPYNDIIGDVVVNNKEIIVVGTTYLDNSSYIIPFVSGNFVNDPYVDYSRERTSYMFRFDIDSGAIITSKVLDFASNTSATTVVVDTKRNSLWVAGNFLNATTFEEYDGYTWVANFDMNGTFISSPKLTYIVLTSDLVYDNVKDGLILSGIVRAPYTYDYKSELIYCKRGSPYYIRYNITSGKFNSLACFNGYVPSYKSNHIALDSDNNLWMAGMVFSFWQNFPTNSTAFSCSPWAMYRVKFNPNDEIIFNGCEDDFQLESFHLDSNDNQYLSSYGYYYDQSFINPVKNVGVNVTLLKIINKQQKVVFNSYVCGDTRVVSLVTDGEDNLLLLGNTYSDTIIEIPPSLSPNVPNLELNSSAAQITRFGMTTPPVVTSGPYISTGTYYPPVVSVNNTIVVNGTYHNCTFCSSNVYLCSNESNWNNGVFQIQDPRVSNPNYRIGAIAVTLDQMRWCSEVQTSVSVSLVNHPIGQVTSPADNSTCQCDTCQYPHSMYTSVNGFGSTDSVNNLYLQFNSTTMICMISFSYSFTLIYVPPLTTGTGEDQIITNKQPNAEKTKPIANWLIALIICLALLMLILAIIIVALFVSKKKKRNDEEQRKKRQTFEINEINLENYGSLPNQANYAPISTYNNVMTLSSLAKAADSKKLEMRNSADKYAIDPNEVTIEQELGRGAFGTVYKGSWRCTPVAIKRIKSNTIEDDKQAQEFVKEANIMMSIKNHPNVVSFVGMCSDPLCLITELMVNGSLDKFLYDKNNHMDQKMQLSLIKGIAAGMHHLQLESIIHKDLAARNILLNKDLVPKVSDFGLARLSVDNNEPIYSQTDTGPLKWMAPESLTKKQFSVKSDVWSYGITCVEILTREGPYPDLDNIEYIKRALEDTLEPASYIPSDTTPALRQMITQCFSKDPAQRPTFLQILELTDMIDSF